MNIKTVLVFAAMMSWGQSFVSMGPGVGFGQAEEMANEIYQNAVRRAMEPIQRAYEFRLGLIKQQWDQLIEARKQFVQQVGFANRLLDSRASAFVINTARISGIAIASNLTPTITHVAAEDLRPFARDIEYVLEKVRESKEFHAGIKPNRASRFDEEQLITLGRAEQVLEYFLDGTRQGKTVDELLSPSDLYRRISEKATMRIRQEHENSLRRIISWENLLTEQKRLERLVEAENESLDREMSDFIRRASPLVGIGEMPLPRVRRITVEDVYPLVEAVARVLENVVREQNERDYPEGPREEQVLEYFLEGVRQGKTIDELEALIPPELPPEAREVVPGEQPARRESLAAVQGMPGYEEGQQQPISGRSGSPEPVPAPVSQDVIQQFIAGGQEARPYYVLFAIGTVAALYTYFKWQKRSV